MNTKLITVMVFVLLVAPVAGVSALDESEFDGKLSPIASDMTGILGPTTPDSAITYGSNNDPGFFVYYSDRDDLETWVADHDDREFISNNTRHNRSLVRAPSIHVLGGFVFQGLDSGSFSDPLVEQDWVDHIAVNTQQNLVEPIDTLDSESQYQRPVRNLFLRNGEFTSEGVAFDGDADQATLQEVRDATGTRDLASNGSNVNVSVIDTGANVGDGEIYGNGTAGSTIRITHAKNFISNQSVTMSDPEWSVVEDGNGHGSWVASAIAANVTETKHDGIAPGADLMIAKALTDDGSGTTEDIADAINWSENNGADVVSMSLGSPTYSPVLAEEIRAALDGNVSVVVVAVGNSRMNPAVRYVGSPADVPESGVIGVAATNTKSPGEAMSAYFSNVGPDTGTRDLSNGVTTGVTPDVAAPGMKIQSPVLTATDGTRQNKELSGTSMATPIVAGTLAIAIEDNSWQNDTSDIEEYIADASSPIANAGVTEVGNGMINGTRLVEQNKTDTKQADEVSDEALARDEANTAYSGSRFLELLAGVGA